MTATVIAELARLRGILAKGHPLSARDQSLLNRLEEIEAESSKQLSRLSRELTFEDCGC